MSWPPAYVKPYVKRQKNDATDAEAICEAVTRANMRFVETKTPEQQSCLMLHRTRHLFIRQQTSVINAIRAHMAEFGIVAPVGRQGVEALLEVVADVGDNRVPEVARACLAALGTQLRMLKAQILEFDRMIMAWHRSNETSRRLDAIPGVGPTLATALVASVADPKAFRSGRNFSAWIGLVPKQHSSGGKHKLGSISKQGDRYLRSLQPERTQRIGICRVFRRLEADLHVALGGQIINLIWLRLLQDPDEIGGVGQIAVMQEEPRFTLVRINIERVDTGSVERRGPPLDSMHHVSFVEQKPGKISAILAGHTRD